MDLLSIIRITIRRWVVVVPVLLLTLAALVLVTTNRTTDYTMSGSYLLVPGDVRVPSADPVNPADAADALRSQLLQLSVQQQLVDEGLSGDYDATLSETGASLGVVVRAGDSETALATSARIVELAPDLLTDAFGSTAASTVGARSLTDLGDAANVVAEGEGEAQRFVVRMSILVAKIPAQAGNPFPPNQATVRSIINVATSPSFGRRVAAESGLTDYAVTGGIREAPIIDITVTATSPVAAQNGFGYVRDAVIDGLEELQNKNGVDFDRRTSFVAIVEPGDDDVEVNPSSIIRPAAGIVVLGGGLAVALAALVETVAAFRRHRGVHDWLDAGEDRPTESLDEKAGSDAGDRELGVRVH